MRSVSVLVLLSLLCVAASAFPFTAEETRMLFTSWSRQHGRQYATVEELNHRFAVWSANLQVVHQHNAEAAAGKHTYTLGMNKLADLTVEEYRQKFLGGYRRSNSSSAAALSNIARKSHTYVPRRNVQLPSSVDWRDKGLVTAVKDQGQCGSCWSFSSTGSMEGAHAMATGSLVPLSEQQLIDCVNDGQFTCDTGGEMTVAFQYLTDGSGTGSEGEDDYPYCTCSGNQCNYDASAVRATFTSYKTIPQGDESALQSAAAERPGVAVAIDASSQQFQLYSSGVFNNPSCSSTELDHGVLVVGYGSSNGTPYWIVKNSWSDQWGLSGYIWMSRNKNNQCGIATDASYILA